MRKFVLLAVVGALAFPAGAGAVTLDPGERLTVVCKKGKPFRGLPFTDGETDERLSLQTRRQGWRFFAIRNPDFVPVGPTTHEDAKARYLASAVVERRAGTHRFRLTASVGGQHSTRWRGC